MSSELIVLIRDVEAIEIPSGDKTAVKAGTEVSIHQVLGGNYTVQTYDGQLVRIGGKDADSLGKEIEESFKPAKHTGEKVELKAVVDSIWDQLRTVYDPEIPSNIVELGLVYEVKVEPAEEDLFNVDVKMTLTAPGCGMGPVLEQDALSKIQCLAGVQEAKVEIVLDPPWDPSRMSEAARLQLGMM